MILVTGGAYEGKTGYVRKRFGFSDDEITDGRTAKPEDILHAACIVNYHEFIKKSGASESPEAFTERLTAENPDAVVVMNEIGCGIIPLEKSERIWREQTGRCGCIIASASEEVIRICCGIPAVIKGGNHGN